MHKPVSVSGGGKSLPDFVSSSLSGNDLDSGCGNFLPRKSTFVVPLRPHGREEIPPYLANLPDTLQSIDITTSTDMTFVKRFVIGLALR